MACRTKTLKVIQACMFWIGTGSYITSTTNTIQIDFTYAQRGCLRRWLVRQVGQVVQFHMNVVQPFVEQIGTPPSRQHTDHQRHGQLNVTCARFECQQTGIVQRQKQIRVRSEIRQRQIRDKLETN